MKGEKQQCSSTGLQSCLKAGSPVRSCTCHLLSSDVMACTEFLTGATLTCWQKISQLTSRGVQPKVAAPLPLNPLYHNCFLQCFCFHDDSIHNICPNISLFHCGSNLLVESATRQGDECHDHQSPHNKEGLLAAGRHRMPGHIKTE